MAEDLRPTITRAGLAAVRNAQGTGVLATIDAIGVGRGIASGSTYIGYQPSGAERALRDEAVRVPLLSGQNLGGADGGDPIGFRVLAEVPALVSGEYPITEVGFFLTDGTLLMVWSSPDEVFAYRTSQSSLDLALDLFLISLPVSSMTIAVQRPDIPDTTGVLAELMSCQMRTFIADLAAEARSVARGVY